MRSIIRNLRIQFLEAKLEASRLHCASLVSQFEIAPTNAEKTEIAQRYDDALKQTHAMPLSLELLKREAQGC